MFRLFRTPLVAAVALAMTAVPVVSALDLENPATQASSWIVGFYEMPDVQVGDQYNGAEVISVTPELTLITVETVSFELFNARATLDENVRYVETDVSDHQLFFTPNDFYVNHATNYAMNKIGLVAAWDATLGTTAVKDGHIDSGIFRTHEDFGARFLQGWDFKNGDNTPEDTSACSWHGSHTAGTVGATINNGKGFPGTAQINILPIKIFHGKGGGPYACAAATTTNLANAIKYAGDQGSHVSSNSWGGGAFSTAINDAITYSRGKGTIFVAAAGNGGCSNCIGAPWESQEANVIIVTATDVNDNGASFNSKGFESDVSAPGVDIGSAGGPNVNSYYIMSGTSMATPYVAGVVGLIKTLNPSFTEAQVQARLKTTALDLGVAGEDDTFGAGRIRANLAVF